MKIRHEKYPVSCKEGELKYQHLRNVPKSFSQQAIHSKMEENLRLMWIQTYTEAFAWAGLILDVCSHEFMVQNKVITKI